MRDVVVALILFAFAFPIRAQPDEVMAALINSLPSRNIGPANMGGRIVDLDVVESNPNIIYVGAATGGIWKTSNAGKTWASVFDNQGTLCIGAVTVAPSNPDIIWVGTGEANARNSVSWGVGVYKSIDAGKTWQHMGLKETRHIGRVVVHPKNPDIVYVAAMGRFWGPNKERGLYKTIDGGKTWQLTKFVDDETGFIDAAIDPEQPDIVYACAYRVRRDGFSGGNPAIQTGDGAGIYRTEDAGRTWEKLGKGLPERPYGRCGIAVYRKDPKIVYAVVQTDKSPITTIGATPKAGNDISLGGIFRSADKGNTWEKLNDLCPRPFYYGQIRIDPSNDKRIYVLGVAFYSSNDGGKSFAAPAKGGATPGPHPDHHALWINPKDSNHLVLGNDGGLYFSKDKTRTWEPIRGMALGQFYGIAADMRQPYRVYGGLQDNGTWGGPSATKSAAGIVLTDWKRHGGGDGFQVAIDPTEPDTVYQEIQYGGLARLNLKVQGVGAEKRIKPGPATGKLAYRFNWESPIVLSPHDPKVIYYGGNHVFKSLERGDKWEVISPDLTRGMPGPSPVNGHTITALAESPKKAGVFYAGTDDGKLHVSKDDGKTWTDLSEKLPFTFTKFWVNRIECSHFDEATAFVAIDRHRNEDLKPYIFKTTDYGATWKPLAGDLPEGVVVHVIGESSKNRDLLFAGTEVGLFASLDGGKRWHSMKNGIPAAVPVYDLVIHPRDRDLVIGTHGRSIYIVDIAPLEELTDKVIESPAHLFAIKPAFTFKPEEPTAPPQAFVGSNPPFGAVVHFYLKEEMPVTLSISDSNGRELRKMEVKGQKGLQSAIWNLRGERKDSPLVAAGEYTATLKAGVHVLTQKFKVQSSK